MNSTLINGLFIFMLACFIGFEVIRRVSPLLHTPLMSLTNALDAIAVVGAIALVGQERSRLSVDPGHDRDRGRDQQRRRRILHHRPHAQDVQVQPSSEQSAMNALPGTEYIIEFCYLIASALFIFSLKWMSSPATARRGIMAGEIGMVLAIGGTLLQHDIITYKWIFVGLALGTIIGIPLGMVQMTAVPQRTALSHAFGALCVTLVGTSEFYLNRRTSRSSRWRVVVRGHPWRTDLHRQPDGRGQIAGGSAAAPDHL